MSFVVEKVPFRDIVVGYRTSPVVGVSEGFDASAKDRVLFEKLPSTLPNNFANLAGFGTT